MLADGNKLAIIEALMDGPSNVTGLGTQLGIAQSLLSHHLRGLRDEGLVTTSRRGREVVYELQTSVKVSRRDRTLELGCCRIQLR